MKPNEFIVEVDFTEDEESISVGGRNIEIPQVVFLKPVKEWFEPDPNPRADWKGLSEKLRSELRAMGNDDAGTATFRFEFGDEADPQKKREFMECVRQYHLGAEAEETETVKNVQDYLAEAPRKTRRRPPSGTARQRSMVMQRRNSGWVSATTVAMA